MSFVLRLCFWFGLVLLLIPAGTFGTSDGGNAVGPVQAANAAREAFSDTMGICQRKPHVCETAKEAFHTIAVRAKETARVALEYVNEQTDNTATGSIDSGDEKVSRPAIPLPQKDPNRQ
jgi:hypothetical protein